ncbi:MAG: CotH kinase family protein [bacterium]|nr:CotH kinase family protein [bacterium]
MTTFRIPPSVRFLRAFLILVAAVFSAAAAPASGQPPVPRFSAERGFYRDPFPLRVTTDGGLFQIRYTVDGSDPRTSPTGRASASPLVLTVDPEDTAGRGTAPGFIVRAASVESDTVFSAVVTHTYLFVRRAGALSPDGVPPGPGWPGAFVNGQRMDYGLDPDVMNDPRYRDKMEASLLSLPAVSLTTGLENLFSVKTGIYVNAMQHGEEWERPVSVEWIDPNGDSAFQIDAGLRIRGGYSRHGQYPKHAFRLFFREEYGAAKLRMPLFGEEGVSEFDKIDLRTPMNYHWSCFGDQGVFNIMVRDVYSRDLQRDMGRPYTRSRFYHLYLDGTYWGVYQTQERSEARFAASYLGGDPDDYDVVKVATDIGYVIEATDGTLDSWRAVWDLSQAGFESAENYAALLGLGPDGERDPARVRRVDIDNLIDYMIIIFQTGDFDAPVTKFGQNQNPNNFYAVFNRVNPDGFKFFVHDAEHSLFTSRYADPGIGLFEDRVNIGSLTDWYRMDCASFDKFHPQWLHHRLCANADYRIRFADRVYRHFFNDGALTAEANIRRFMSRVREIDMAIIAESARWGDAQVSTPRTKHDDWLPQVDNVVDNFFPFRNGIVLDQLRQAGLWPELAPPVFKAGGMAVECRSITAETAGRLSVSNPNAGGTVWVTTDGTDPRLPGGAVSGRALSGLEPSVDFRSTTRVKARVLDGNVWSALAELTVRMRDDLSGLKITEIHYHPLDADTVDGRELEFVELKNTSQGPLNLTDAVFTNGIDFTFPASAVLEPGGFIVLASNAVRFHGRYGFFPFGEYAGQLDNGGERIVLLSAAGDTVLQMRYDDRSPWPAEPDSMGFSLVSRDFNPAGDPNDPLYWRVSVHVHGSPGREDDGTAAVRGTGTNPADFGLLRNYPNPFNPRTALSYVLPVRGRVTLTVFDASGRRVRVLADGVQDAGPHEIAWDASDDAGRAVPSGLYIGRLSGPAFDRTVKMILMR